jgi:hypothetical protein
MNPEQNSQPQQPAELRAQLEKEWQAAKAKFEQAQQMGQAAMADALRAEGALRLLAHLHPESAPAAEGN